MKVLVTGGAGYIGSVVVANLIEIGHQISVLDDLSTGNKNYIHPKAKFILGSILNKETLENAMQGCDYVVHLAAKSVVNESVKYSELYFETNTKGTINVLECMKKLSIKNLLFASTSAIYKPSDEPLDEFSENKPSNPYAQSKFEAEKEILKYSTQTGINSIIFRFFNVSGSYYSKSLGWIRESHNPETHLIPNLFTKKSDQKFAIFGNDWPTKDGTCVRDYVHVEDIAAAINITLEKMPEFKGELINLGNSEGFTILELINIFNKTTNSNLSINYEPRRSGDVAVLVSNCQKAFRILGWKPLNNLSEILNSVKKSHAS
jgi:UDP-glucose 4-epimerase